MYRSEPIYCSNGGHIFLRPLIISQATIHRPAHYVIYRMLTAALVLLLFCLPPVCAAPLRVTLAVSEESGAYQVFSETLRNKLQSEGYELKIMRADDSFGGADLYIAVGMKAATQIASRDIPTLYVLVPKTGYDKLQHEPTLHTAPRSAIYLDQPIERQVALLMAALPGVRHVGVLYSSAPSELPVIRHVLKDKNMQLHDGVVDRTHTLNDALEGVLEESEVLFVLPDAEVYNASTIRNVLLTSYRKKVPLLGISPAYVKAGALCAVFTTPEQFADQTVAMIDLFAETGKLAAAQYPVEYEVSVNKQVARSLDLRIRDADKLRDEIRKNP
jgi:putative tryptophan/tyrosine transport system substrate-binding protein